MFTMKEPIHLYAQIVTLDQVRPVDHPDLKPQVRTGMLVECWQLAKFLFLSISSLHLVTPNEGGNLPIYEPDDL